MILRVTVDLDQEADLDVRVVWYEQLKHGGNGHLEIGRGVVLMSHSPARWRDLAAAAAAIATDLDQLYDEHGVKPPEAQQ